MVYMEPNGSSYYGVQNYHNKILTDDDLWTLEFIKVRYRTTYTRALKH